MILLASSFEICLCLLHLLQILTSLITPEHVLKGSLVEMAIDVVESMLGNVTNDQVGMLPDLTTLVDFHVTDEELDEGQLARTVMPKNSDTGGERHLS